MEGAERPRKSPGPLSVALLIFQCGGLTGACAALYAEE